MSTEFWIACAVTTVASAITLFAERVESEATQQRLKWVFKPLAASGFIAAALIAGALNTTYGVIVLVGLALSMVGDVLLIPRSTGKAFLGGLGAFLLGHVAYAVAFAVRGVDPVWAAVGGVVWFIAAVGIGRWLLPNVSGRMRTPVIAYIVVITTMATLAFATHGAVAGGLIPIAATGFLLSDISVARDRFMNAGFGNRAWGLPLYFAAQLAFAATIADPTGGF